GGGQVRADLAALAEELVARGAVLRKERLPVGRVAGAVAGDGEVEPGDAGLLLAGGGRGELAEVLLDEGPDARLVQADGRPGVVEGEVGLGERAGVAGLEEFQRPRRPGQEDAEGALPDLRGKLRVELQQLAGRLRVLEAFQPADQRELTGFCRWLR